PGDFLYIADADFHICFLKSGVGGTESNIDLRLDIFGLIDKLHELPDKNIPFFIHEVEALSGKSQGILCQYQVSFSGKGIGIHIITSLLENIYLFFLCRFVVFVQYLSIDSVQFFFWYHAQQFPAFVQSFGDTPVLISTLAYKFVLKGLSKFQIDLIYRGELILADYRGQGSGVSYLCITGEKLVGHILMIFSRKAFSNTILHQTGKRGQYVNRGIDSLSMKL